MSTGIIAGRVAGVGSNAGYGVPPRQGDMIYWLVLQREYNFPGADAPWWVGLIVAVIIIIAIWPDNWIPK